MLECSDLKTKTKAKTFHKPTVKEILVTNTRSASFQQSQNAAKWQNATDAVADALSEMFTVEGRYTTFSSKNVVTLVLCYLVLVS